MWIGIWFLRRWSHILLLGMESYACLKSMKAVHSRDEPLYLLCCVFEVLQDKQQVQRADKNQIVCPGSCCVGYTSFGPWNVANWHEA